MLSSIEINKDYELYLNPIYGGTKYNVHVIGTTFLDSVSKNEEDYNIYQTYFQPIGLGLTSYYTAIHDNTPIYICLPLESLDPLEIGSEKLFIPSTLIDMDSSDVYVKAYTFDINISPIIKRLDNDNELASYKTELQTKITERLNKLIDLALIDPDVTITDSVFYTTETDISTLENERSEAYNAYVKRLQEESSAESAKNLAYNAKILEMENAIAEAKATTAEYKKKAAYLDDLIATYEKLKGI